MNSHKQDIIQAAIQGLIQGGWDKLYAVFAIRESRISPIHGATLKKIHEIGERTDEQTNY